MSGWKECKIADAPFEIIDGDRGTNYPKQDEFNQNGYCLFLNAKNVTTDGFVFNACYFISKEKDEILRKGKLKRNDIVLTTRGTVGNIGFFNDRIPYEQIRINSGMVIIRPDPKGIMPQFAHQLFKYLKGDFDVFVTGSAQPQLPIRDLKEISFLLPPLSEQRAIAGVLSSLDDKIDLLHRQNKTLEGMAEALYRKMFVPACAGGPHADREEADPEWKKGKLGDIVSVTTGKGLKKDEYIENGVYPVIGANGEIGRTNKYLTDEKLILTGRVGTLGKIKITNEKIWISDNVLIVKPLKDIYFHFVYFLLKRIDFENLNVGSTQPLVTQTDLKNIEIEFPINADLDYFVTLCESVFNKIEQNSIQIRTLSRLRDTLLPKLMSGEVRVGIKEGLL